MWRHLLDSPRTQDAIHGYNADSLHVDTEAADNGADSGIRNLREIAVLRIQINGIAALHNRAVIDARARDVPVQGHAGAFDAEAALEIPDRHVIELDAGRIENIEIFFVIVSGIDGDGAFYHVSVIGNADVIENDLVGVISDSEDTGEERSQHDLAITDINAGDRPGSALNDDAGGQVEEVWAIDLIADQIAATGEEERADAVDETAVVGGDHRIYGNANSYRIIGHAVALRAEVLHIEGARFDLDGQLERRGDAAFGELQSPLCIAVADFNGDGRADIVTENDTTNLSVFLSACLIPTPRYGFDGDGKSDISVYRPSSGIWYTLRSSDNSFTTQSWGISTDKVVTADYDGDSKTDLAVYRPSTGAWYLLRSTNSTFISQSFGISTDTPVPADYDGDGKADVAVYRAGIWCILRSSDNQFVAQSFGISTDKAVPADYDGDGKADIAVYRSGSWYIQQSGNNQLRGQLFGTSTDLPVAGDYDGDGKADVAAYRPSTGTWYAMRSSNNSLLAQGWGIQTDVPVPADYGGDGKTDLAVYRPSSGVWYIQRSADDLMTAQPFGLSTDLPVEAAPLAP